MQLSKIQKRKLRFRKQLFSINGIYNIEGIIICSDYGYAFETYCCKNCGEIYVVDLEAFGVEHVKISLITKGQNCQKCSTALETSLVAYPKNIFYNGTIQSENIASQDINLDETDIIDVYVIQ